MLISGAALTTFVVKGEQMKSEIQEINFISEAYAEERLFINELKNACWQAYSNNPGTSNQRFLQGFYELYLNLAKDSVVLTKYNEKIKRAIDSNHLLVDINETSLIFDLKDFEFLYRDDSEENSVAYKKNIFFLMRL